MNFLYYNLKCSHNISSIMILDNDVLGLEVISIILSKMNCTLTMRNTIVVPCAEHVTVETHEM